MIFSLKAKEMEKNVFNPIRGRSVKGSKMLRLWEPSKEGLCILKVQKLLQKQRF
ncbi:hypothetical protein MtrunA17_Chr4g0011111 [Medicago truncatula]|uniref:Uncharacterized protein n=1 Tax=Medicago truncatula TaxID=3880 RepID=A0A396I0Y3_MEDTR|nr:hypothetical protein MtrunA17_Chr4g0011111 [Medicago truncatula]